MSRGDAAILSGSCSPLVEKEPWQRAVEHARRLLPELAGIVGQSPINWTVSSWASRHHSADATTKITIRDGQRKPRAMYLCSSPLAPDQVAQAVALSARAKAQLSDGVGDAILSPLSAGHV